MISSIKALLFILLISMHSHSMAAQDQAANISPRIIGGTDVAQAYPWMVSIQADSHFCGGTLIHQDWVLTAAHCMEGVTAEQITLWVGAQDLASVAADTSLAERHSVAWIASHADYDRDTLWGDIAILRLAQSSHKTPLNLISSARHSALASLDVLRIMGWGLTDATDEHSISNILQEVDVSFQSDEVCDATYPGAGGEYWQQGLCAGEVSGGKDSCQGDSGGPLLLFEDGEWWLTGIVSWGDGCGENGKFGVYAEVAYYLDWIAQRQHGVTLLGADKIGFLGLGRTKSDVYKLVNSGTVSAQINTTAIAPAEVATFAIDDSRWSSYSLPAGSDIELSIEALGSIAGEHDSKAQIYVDDYLVQHKLNAKVLQPVDAVSLGVNWPFFSGTGEQTEHAQPWLAASDEQRGQVLKSGAIGAEERSVLVSYLSGSGNGQAHYLKFDARVDSHPSDGLLVVINQGFPEEEAFLIGADKVDWFSNTVALPRNGNHILFIYIKDRSLQLGSDAAYLANFRICTDISNDPNEDTCSKADDFYNQDKLVAIEGRTDEPDVSEPDVSESDVSELDSSAPALFKESSGSLFYLYFLLPSMLLCRPRPPMK